MEISRRNALLTAFFASLAGTGMAGRASAAANAQDTQDTSADLTHILRHYVIPTKDDAAMDAMLAELKEKLDLDSQPKKELTNLGFTTAMVIIGKTVLEVVAPLGPNLRPSIDAFVAERGGPGVSKIVFQSFNPKVLRERLYKMKIKLEVDRQFRTSQMITLATEMFGTSLEAFDYTPLDKWWGYDSSIDYPESSVIQDVMGCDVVIDNPAAVATLVAYIFNAELDNESNIVTFQENFTVPYKSRYMRFESPMDERRGVLTLDVLARDRSRVGETIAVTGVDFKLV